MKFYFKDRIKLCLYILLIGFIIFPKAVTLFNETADAYVYSSFSVAQASIKQNRISVNPFEPTEIKGKTSPWQSHANGLSNRVAVTSFLVIFMQITGLKQNILLFLPITGLIIVLQAFILGRLFTKSLFIALLYALFLSYERNALNNIFYVSLGFAFHFLFIIALFKILDVQAYKRRNLFLLLIFFGLSFLTYYSAEGLNLVLITFVSVIILLSKSNVLKAKLSRNFNNLTQIAVALGIFFIAFENMFLRYLEIASFKRLWQHLSDYLNYAINFITGNISQKTVFGQVKSNITMLYVDLIMRILLILPILAYLLYFITCGVIRPRRSKINCQTIFLIALTAVSVLETFVYWSYGPAGGFRYFYYLGPLLAFYSLHYFGCKLNKKKIFSVLILLIFLLALLKFTIIWQDPTYSYDGRHYYSLMESTTRWVIKHVKGNVLSDFHVSGRLLAEAALYSKANEIYSYKFYEDLDLLYEYNQTKVDEVFNKNEYKYVILSYAFRNQVVLGDIWSPQGPPLGHALSFFDLYTSFNRIYDDGRGLIYNHR